MDAHLHVPLNQIIIAIFQLSQTYVIFVETIDEFLQRFVTMESILTIKDVLLTACLFFQNGFAQVETAPKLTLAIQFMEMVLLLGMNNVMTTIQLIQMAVQIWESLLKVIAV